VTTTVRHPEIPERRDVAWYQSCAEALLGGYQTGEAEAMSRVAEALGVPTPGGLGEAQRVVALEHGFASWPDLLAAVQNAALTRAVARIGGDPLSAYEDRARDLVSTLLRGDSSAHLRAVANLPRFSGHITYTDARSFAPNKRWTSRSPSC